jgi:hypothetical protein
MIEMRWYEDSEGMLHLQYRFQVPGKIGGWSEWYTPPIIRNDFKRPDASSTK